MRTDLLALTPESLVLLSNAGLVKRAQKEVEAGTGPKLEEAEDGTVTAVFRDGATTRLERNTALRNTACTCGASTVCRHRLCAVLAYQKQHGGTVEAAPVVVAEPWDPGALPDTLLATVCGEATLARARKALEASLLVTTKPGLVPVAALPSSTLQFLVPRDLAFARCDCAKGHSCEHVALAVWAFRRCPQGGVVELGNPDDSGHAPALIRVEAALLAVARRGLTEPGLERELEPARASADAAGLVWLVDALEELERQREAYHRQSALFSARTCALLVAELAGRIRAARHPGDLPARWILGSDEARETHLEQVRLIALGARLEADGDRRLAQLSFADTDTRNVLVLRKEWTFEPGTAKNGADLGALFASSRLSLAALSKGELITRAARRRANGLIDLSAARGMKTAVLPADAAWGELPAPILIRDLAAHGRTEQDQPPRMLRPRRLGGDIHVVAIGKVVDVGWDAAAQELIGLVEDTAGERLILRTPHRTVAPGAVDAVRDALSGSPRYVSGALRRSQDGWETWPLAIVGEKVTVPDLEKPRKGDALPAGTAPHVEGLAALLGELETLVDRAVLKGESAVRAQVAPLADRLRAGGLERIAAQVQAVGASRPDALLDVAIARALIAGAARLDH